MTRSTRTILTALAVCGGLGLLAVPASALPIAPKSALVTSASSDVEPVGWRCGRYRHMNRWGRCVRNRW